MAKPRALVLTGFGINCDGETKWALDKAGANAERVHINDLIERQNMADYQMVVFPGGFSYGDDIRSGKVLAEKVKANLKEPMQKFIEDEKLFFGFCNGFQVMVALGLLPGFDDDYFTQKVALAANDSNQYEDRWVELRKPEKQGDKCVLTRGIHELYLPVAHGEGKFFAEQSTIDRIEEQGLVVFRYSLENGKPAGGKYPYNPNSSINDIAGVCDPTGRVFGMMPHPERFLDPTNHPDWSMIKEKLKRDKMPIPEAGEGVKVFQNAVNYFK